MVSYIAVSSQAIGNQCQQGRTALGRTAVCPLWAGRAFHVATAKRPYCVNRKRKSSPGDLAEYYCLTNGIPRRILLVFEQEANAWVGIFEVP